MEQCIESLKPWAEMASGVLTGTLALLNKGTGLMLWEIQVRLAMYEKVGFLSCEPVFHSDQ